MSKPKIPPLLPPELAQHVAALLPEYRGYCPELAEAIGALVFGQAFGWKGVFMIYSRSKVRSMGGSSASTSARSCRSAPLSSRILGIRLADEIGKFWAVVKGEVRCRAARPTPTTRGRAICL